MKINNSSKLSIMSVFLLLILLASAALGEDLTHRSMSLRRNSMQCFNRNLLMSEPDSVEVNGEWEPPSKSKAFLFSLILPGSGEYYAGSRTMAKIFFSTEVMLWATYFSFRAYGNMKKDDYIRYAIVHAGIDQSDKDYDYYVNIENYDNLRDYNSARLQQRRVDEVYPDNDYYYWQWDSHASRLEYERIRIASDNAFSRSIFVIGGILINHIISGIDAVRAAKSQEIPDENRLRMGVSLLPEGGMTVNLCKQF